MRKLIAIVAGEPISINSEIIAKAWKKINKRNFFVIGNYLLFKKQLSKIGIKLPLQKISTLDNFKFNSRLNILDIPLKFKFSFKTNKNKRKYVLQCLDLAHELAITKKIKGFVNAPIDKQIFNSKYLGVTEYLASKNNAKNKEIMMIYNKKLSVVPLTTHIDISKIRKKIKTDLIKKKIIILNDSFKTFFNKKPRIAILGLNPHNSENRKNSIENKIIKPLTVRLKKKGINISGPFPSDTIFMKEKRRNYNVVVGMYHDQVLSPFKALYGFNAVNVTLGLKYIRTSPDHGTASNIAGKNKANASSLVSSINFINNIKNG
jgi:4-hydroxythreonine-4-phosphate dehydrogenase